MNDTRKIKLTLKARTTMEGAGVKLKRVFGYNEIPLFDPFLLLDHFGSDNPNDYLKGFPWHPHRGIETITYMINGKVQHRDSLGNEGIISSGDIQWMTAGSGIIHEEMPKRTDGNMMGFQLWANLPKSHKMMNPRYQDIKESQIPIINLDNNVIIKVICGDIQGIKGPVKDIITEPEYLDIEIPPNTEFVHEVKSKNTVFAYIFEGSGYFDDNLDREKNVGELVVYQEGSNIKITTKDSHVRFLLISGKPIEESIAWGGPIVMNTKEELQLAFNEFNNGTFIKATS
ncbi:MAG: pirin family protein [Promethearchaeota archaeon]